MTFHLPSHIHFLIYLKPRGGPVNPGVDISAVQTVGAVLMTLEPYFTNHRIHGLYIHEDLGLERTRLFFYGYKCEECGEVFLVPDTVKDDRTLSHALAHDCAVTR